GAPIGRPPQRIRLQTGCMEPRRNMTATAEPVGSRTWDRLEGRLKFSFAGMLLHSFRFPAAQLNVPFLDLGNDPAATARYLPQLPVGVEAAVIYSHPLDHPLTRIRFEPEFLRYARSHYRRFLIDVSG